MFYIYDADVLGRVRSAREAVSALDVRKRRNSIESLNILFMECSYVGTLSQTLPKALPLETANFCVQKFDKKLRFMLAGGFVYNERSRRLRDLRESETFDFPSTNNANCVPTEQAQSA